MLFYPTSWFESFILFLRLDTYYDNEPTYKFDDYSILFEFYWDVSTYFVYLNLLVFSYIKFFVWEN